MAGNEPEIRSLRGPSAHPAFASGYGGQAAEGYT